MSSSNSSILWIKDRALVRNILSRGGLCGFLTSNPDLASVSSLFTTCQHRQQSTEHPVTSLCHLE